MVGGFDIWLVTVGRLVVELVGSVGWSVGWLVPLVGWSLGWLVGPLVGRLVGRSVAWLVGSIWLIWFVGRSVADLLVRSF